jgi:GT2 family glycosyltransferase
MTSPPRISIVVLTYNRRDEVIANLRLMIATEPQAPIIVVDNHSTDGTAAALRRHFPHMRVLRTDRNMGAAARNLGVRASGTPYVAFCDDDTRWEPHALIRAVEVMDRHQQLAIINGKVLVGPEGRVDPTCDQMACSPLGRIAGHWPILLGFMAGACVVRTSAFLTMGGYEPRLFLGAEETLLCLDMVAGGWKIAYVDNVATYHFPSAVRDGRQRTWLLARNSIWIAWSRLPFDCAWRETREQLRRAAVAGLFLRTCIATLRGMPWALRHRRVVPDTVAAMWRCLHIPPARPAPNVPSASATRRGKP